MSEYISEALDIANQEAERANTRQTVVKISINLLNSLNGLLNVRHKQPQKAQLKLINILIKPC